jgi:hypothetical protein
MGAIFVRRPEASSCTIRDRLMQLMHDFYGARLDAVQRKKNLCGRGRKRQKKFVKNRCFTLKIKDL